MTVACHVRGTAPPRAWVLAVLCQGLRAQAGLTQAELARRMGNTQSSIARAGGGGSLPALGVLGRLARVSGIGLCLAASGITGIDLGGAA
jgi:transcriptional regulator with XRE-family HTH domain